MSNLEPQDIAGTVKASVNKYIETLETPTSTTPTDKLEVLKWEGGGHLATPNEENIELCNKVSNATNPVTEKQDLLVSDDIKAKLTNEVSDFQERRAASCNGCKAQDGSVLFVSEDAKKSLTEQIQLQNGTETDVNGIPEVTPIPVNSASVNTSAITEGDTPWEKLESRMGTFKETSVYNTTISDTQEQISQDMFKASASPITPDTQKALSKAVSDQKVTQDLANQYPLVSEYNVIKANYLDYTDSLGYFQNQSPLNEPVTTGFNDFTNLGSSIETFYSSTDPETASLLTDVSLSTESLPENISPETMESLSSIRDNMTSLEGSMQNINELDVQGGFSEKITAQRVEMWQHGSDLEGGLDGFSDAAKTEKFASINALSSSMASGYNLSSSEIANGQPAGRLFSSTMSSMSDVKFPDEVVSIEQNMKSITDVQSQLLSCPVDTAVNSGLLNSGIAKMQDANGSILSSISSIQSQNSQYDINSQLTTVRGNLGGMNSTLSDYSSTFSYSSSGSSSFSDLKGSASSYSEGFISNLITSNSQLAQMSDMSNNFKTINPADTLFTTEYRPLNNFGSMLMMKKLYTASQGYDELGLAQQNFGGMLDDYAMNASLDVDALKGQMGDILPYSPSAFTDNMQMINNMNKQLMDKFSPYSSYYDSLNSLGDDYLATADSLTEMMNPIDFVESASSISNIKNSLMGIVDNVYNLGNNYVSSFLDSQPILGQMMSNVTNLASNMSGLVNLQDGADILNFYSSTLTDTAMTYLDSDTMSSLTSPDVYVATLANNFVSSNGIDNLLETAFELENMMAGLDQDTLLDLIDEDAIPEFLDTDELMSSYGDYSDYTDYSDMVQSYSDEGQSYMNSAQDYADSMYDEVLDEIEGEDEDDIDYDEGEFDDEGDEDVDPAGTLAAATAGSQLQAGSSTGMLQCATGVAPFTLLVAPSTESYQGSSTMVATIAPTLTPSCGGCLMASNPTAGATLYVPPYQCIANLLAPFIPGNVTFMVMKGSSPATQMNDQAMCLFAAGGTILVIVPGQTNTLK